MQFHLAESRLRLTGTYVTVDMKARGSDDPMLWKGPIQLVAQNQYCALEEIGNKTYLAFPDGCRLPLVPRQRDGPTTDPTTQPTDAQFLVAISGGRIDSAPVTLRDAILTRGECAASARRLATAWLSSGGLDFYGRSVARNTLLTSLVSDRTIDFHAHARLTQAGEALLRDALSTSATTQAVSAPAELPIIYAASAEHLSRHSEELLQKIIMPRCGQGTQRLWFIYCHREDRADIFSRPETINGRIRKGHWLRITDLDSEDPSAGDSHVYIQVSANHHPWPSRLEIPEPSVLWGLPVVLNDNISDEDAMTIVDSIREHEWRIQNAGQSVIELFDSSSTASWRCIYFNNEDTAGEAMFFSGSPGQYQFQSWGSWVD